MLEIFLVIFLSRRIKGIVEPKGYKPIKWQAYAIFLWIGAEVLGILISILFVGSNLLINAISGYLCAIGAALVLQQRAKNLPDLNLPKEEWMDNIGIDQD